MRVLADAPGSALEDQHEPMMVPAAAIERARRSGPQAGFSLIEVLAAMAIFMLVAVSIFTGVTVVIRSDSAQKGRSTVTVASRNYSDALADSAYVSCGTPADYSTETIGWTPPSGTSVSVTSVRYWNRSAVPAASNPTEAQWSAAFGATCGSDTGLQRITYTVISNAGGRISKTTESALKRFNGSRPEPQADPPPGGNLCVIAASDRVSTAWVNETAGKKDTNYSTGSSSGEMNILYLAGTRRFSYLKFDLRPATPCVNGGTLPSSANIVAAEVSLYTFNIGGAPACGANSCWHVMERVQGAWDQSNITWNNQPCPTGYGDSCQAGGTKSTILFEHGTGAFNWGPRFQRVQATQLLDDVKSFYASPSTNYGWVIKEACAQTYGKACGSATPGFQMRSSRSSDVAQRPTLTVWY